MQRENRRLAAIVAADIAGYSRLIGQDEEGTLRALREHRAKLIDPLIEQHGGRIAPQPAVRDPRPLKHGSFGLGNFSDVRILGPGPWAVVPES